MIAFHVHSSAADGSFVDTESTLTTLSWMFQALVWVDLNRKRVLQEKYCLCRPKQRSASQSRAGAVGEATALNSLPSLTAFLSGGFNLLKTQLLQGLASL